MSTTSVRLQSPPGRPHLVTPSRLDPIGRTGPTRVQSRQDTWRRTSRGRYVPSDVPDCAEQRILEAAAVLPSHGAVTGWAALHWIGARRWHSGVTVDGHPRPVWLAVGGQDVRPHPGVRVSAERLDPRDVDVVDGVRVTVPTRSVCFEMRYAATVRAAVRALSMAAYHDVVSVVEVADYAGQHSGWTGIGRCREALPLAEENCWSPTEVDTVLVWRLDAGLPRPVCNRPVFDLAGRHVGTPDLLDAEAGVVAEYDGAVHLAGGQRARDIDRDERYRAVGLEVVSIVAAHGSAPHLLAERMRARRDRAFASARGKPRWTLTRPPGWQPTHTVELRRALSADEQRRFLRYRRAA